MRWVLLIGLLVLVTGACTSGQTPSSPSSSSQPSDIPPTPSEVVSLLPDEDPPSGAEFEFSTDFGQHSVPFSDIISGGPPKDAIPAIDEPQFTSIAGADEWLGPREPVIFVQIGDEARAYPIQIFMWHEIVNDTIGDTPITITFCPLCNTAIAFERNLDGLVLDFGTTGRLRNSNLIMYDRQTESWWQQATGEAIVGEFTGRRLAFVSAIIMAWDDFKSSFPNGSVLSRETGYARAYGRNPYAGYDDVDGIPFLFDGQVEDGTLPPMARVITVDIDGEAKAYPYDILQEQIVVNDVVAGEPIVILWAPGTASALDAGTVAGGRDVGSAAAYSRLLNGEELSFSFDDEKIVDGTGSEWNVLGQAVSGPLEGSQLAPVVSINHFWFSWAAFRPDTSIYQP